MTLRIDVEQLPGEFAEALSRLESGDEVVFERDGKVVAVLAPPPSTEKGGLRALARDRLGMPPMDEDWERDMAIVAADFNRVVERIAWEK